MASKGDLESETDALTNEDFLPSSTTETNCHQIYQNDESITVVCREPTSDQLSVNDAKYSDKSLSSGCQDKENEKVTITNNVRKFIEGDEIKDSENPFRKPYRKTSKSVRYKLSESDCITKEEILKQSKYVPVYIKNPDSVLTYPILNEKQSQDSKLRKPSPAIRKFPTPAPRTVIEKPKRLNKSKNHQIYPNLSDIKVKVGTDLDETFFDQNEVILNAKKFDSLFNRMKFNSTEDLDDIEALNLKNISHSKADTKDEETKSYTNTVNSKEFREYLQKAGLVLFPVKNSFDVAEPKKQTHMKKKTMIKRLSSIFTRSKMPYSAENEKSFIASNKLDPSRFSSTDSTDYFGVKNNVRAPFKTSDVFSKKKREIHNPDIDDWKSSISSVLSAADTEDYLSSPAFTIKKGQYMAPAGKFQRNQLNQTMPDSYSFEKQDNLNRMNPKLRRNVVLDNHQSYQTSMDPFTFAQIHKVKRQTDENFQKDSWLEPEYQKMPQQHFNSEKKHLRETRLRSVLVNRNLDYQNNLKNNDSHRSSLVSPVKELNREEVMNKIYEYYRKSVNNTPVPRDVKDNLYSTLPNRPVKVNQPNGFARISNPIQNQHKIYDEVNKSSVTSHEFSVKRNLNFNTIGNSSLSMKPAVTCSPMQQPRSNNVSPKKMNSSQRSSLYSSQVFRPISELCSKFFTDSRISRKSKDHQHQRLRILDKNSKSRPKKV